MTNSKEALRATRWKKAAKLWRKDALAAISLVEEFTRITEDLLKVVDQPKNQSGQMKGGRPKKTRRNALAKRVVKKRGRPPTRKHQMPELLKTIENLKKEKIFKFDVDAMRDLEAFLVSGQLDSYARLNFRQKQIVDQKVKSLQSQLSRFRHATNN